MSRKKVKVSCLFCNAEFESILRWEGIPDKEYCSKECELSDEYDEYGEETFEKFYRGSKEEWH